MAGNAIRIRTSTGWQDLAIQGVAGAQGPGGAGTGDTAAWMPLFDSDGALVLDSDEGLIPTLTPIA
jgi:hypothetical protein